MLNSLDDKDEFDKQRLGFELAVVQVEIAWAVRLLPTMLSGEGKKALYDHMRWAVERYSEVLDEIFLANFNARRQG